MNSESFRELTQTLYNSQRTVLTAIWTLIIASTTTLQAYGLTGHEIVGAIADELLAHKPAGAEVRRLLDGMTLERASVIADEIRAWDKSGPDDLSQFPHYRDHPKIDQELRDFWRANPPTSDLNSPVPSHHWFHYTDVPIFSPEKYSEGKVGRSRWDVVHMIPYCASVLRGETPENNERKITRSVAVILLTHYVGDIHQPFHVGAAYFDQAGRAVDPEKTTSSLADEGGNTFTLHLTDDPPPRRGIHYKKLHGFWDQDAVNALLPPITPMLPKHEQNKETYTAIAKIAREMAASEPQNWRSAPNLELKKYAEGWADEILPIAREAHERLQLSHVHSTIDQGNTVAAGEAREKPEPDHIPYREWASDIVRDQLHKAGWRLADLLEKCVKSSATQTATATSAKPSRREKTKIIRINSPSRRLTLRRIAGGL